MIFKILLAKYMFKRKWLKGECRRFCMFCKYKADCKSEYWWDYIHHK